MFSKIKDILKRLIETYGTSDPEELCHRMNIVLLDCDLPAVTKGFCFTISQGRAIVLNNNLERKERRACIAHELGHALLHNGVNYMFVRDSTCMITGKYENEADVFAAMLMLWGKKLPEDVTTEHIAKKYRLSETAVQKALKYKITV